jgi:hypothetical protein
MLDLVPNSRLYGAVQISTTHEAETAQTGGAPGATLSIQITRDRLADNVAFDDLRALVRAGIDLYAMETAREKLAEVEKRRKAVTKPPTTSLRETGRALDSIRDSIPDEVREEFTQLEKQFSRVIQGRSFYNK